MRTLFVLSTVFLWVVLVLVGNLIINSYENEMAKAAQDSLNLTRVIEKEVASTFEKLDLSLREINRVFEFSENRKWSTRDYHNLLAKTAADIPEITAMKLLDKDGNYIGESDGGPELPKLNNSDRRYFQHLKNNPKADFEISEPVISKTLKIWVIVVARRLHSTDGKFAGVVLASIAVDLFEKGFSKLRVGPGANISLFSHTDRVLLARYPRFESKIGQPVKLSEELEQALAQEPLFGNYHAVSAIDDKLKTFGYGVNTKFNFFITVGFADDDYLAEWRTRALFLALSFVAFFGLIAYVLYRYVLSCRDGEAQRLKLIQSSKMASLGEMAGGIAHEINNPLAIIKCHAELLRMYIESGSSDRERGVEILKKIDKTIARIAKIVAGLKTLSRQADSDQMSECGLRQIIDNSLSLCAEKFRQNSVALTVEEVPDVLITCRETQISQVIINLLSNAYDACLESPEKWIKLSFEVKNKSVFIYVTDSGLGINSEIEKKIMQPFFTTKQVGKGTGLGLSISKGIIDQHNGHLSLNSKSKNTQFVCGLPIKKNAA